MKYNILILMSLLFLCKAEAQNNTDTLHKPFHLEIDIPTRKGETIYFGQYWKSGTYAIDSTVVSEKGKATFSSTKEMPDGQYFLYIRPSLQVDLLIGEQQNDIRLQLNENDITKNKVSGSEDTDILWRYLQIIHEADRIKEEIETKKQDGKESLHKLKELFETYKDTVFNQYADKWGTIYIKGLEPVTLPYPEPKTQEEADANQAYGKNHYFDNIDLTDPRFWRTNYMESYIDTYMQQWVEPVPDSLAAAASRLVERARGNDVCFENMLSKLTNESIGSNKMGDENIWARLYEDYIIDKNISWIDDKQHMELSKMYEKIKLNRIGMKARNLRLETLEGDSIDTNEIEAEYTILYFYSPSCGYCKTETPNIHNQLYPKYKDKGLKVITINTGSNREEWEKFINENKLTDWINCADLKYKSQYWMYYDTSGVPSVFVLNKRKEIIAKKLDLENLQKLFNYLIK